MRTLVLGLLIGGAAAARLEAQPRESRPQQALTVTRTATSAQDQVGAVLDVKHAADLDAGSLTGELREQLRAARVPLSANTVVVKPIEPGKRWRLRDDTFLHEVTIERVGGELRAASLSAPVYLREPSGEPAPLTGRISPWQIVYIHKTADGHALIGTSPAATLGWVSAKSVVPWKTRWCLGWDRTKPGRPLGSVWYSAADAHASFSAGEAPLAIAHEPPMGKESPLAEMPFPLLEWPTDLPFDNFRLAGNNTLHRVGVINKSHLRDDELVKLKKALADAHDSHKNIDLMFVIRKTGSMSYHLHAVGDAVRDIGRQILETAKTQLDLRVGITYFWNYENQKDFEARRAAKKELPVAIEPWTAIAKEADFLAVAKRITGAEFSYGGKPPHAQVYLGLAEALDDSRGWRRPNARRVVIVVSDGGNETDFQLPQADADVVVDRILGKDNDPVEFYAVRMAWKRVEPTKSELNSYGLLKKDIERIVDRLKAKSRGGAIQDGRIKLAAGVFDAADSKDLTLAIQDRFADVKNRIEALEKEIQAVQGGRVGRSQWTPQLVEWLRKHGYDPDRIPDRFEEGFVWQKNAQAARQVRLAARVSRAELQRLKTALDNAIAAPPGARRAALETLILHALATLLGEEPAAALSEKEFMAKRQTLDNHLTKLVAEYPFALKDADDDLTRRHLQAVQMKLGELLGPQSKGGLIQFDLPGSKDDWYWIDRADLP